MVSVVIGVSLLLGLIGVGRLLNVYSDTSLSELLYLAPVVVILVQGRFEILRGMKLKPVNILTILWTMLFAALLVPLCILLNLQTQFLVPNVVADMFSSISRMPLLLNLLYCACLPALVEEYLFRGVFYQYFRPYGLLKTALITGLMFGLAHLNLNQFLYAVAIGVFFTFLKDASGSLFACMLAHTVVNGLNVLAQYIATMNLPENVTSAMVEAQSETASVSGLSLIYWILLTAVATAGVILAIIVMRQIAKTCGREKVFSEAAKGRDRRRGKEGKLFSVELIIGIALPLIYMGFRLLLH